jgi:8-oxo-dGTP diphosphatase
MKINKSWHKNNPKPYKEYSDKLLKWFVDHQRECGCKPIPKVIQLKLSQRKPKLVVSVLVKNKNNYLLVKETLESGKVKWTIPGGKVEYGESLESAARREILEETGIRIKKLTYLRFKEAIYPQYNYHTVIFFYLAKTNYLNISEDIEGKVIKSGWFSKQELKKLQLVESAEWLFNKHNI